MGYDGITLCMIVKNEERYLEQCLRSVSDICSDIIIVDTGSTDSTINIAWRHKANVLLHPFAGDFSAARNAALEQVQTKWVLSLDADEEFDRTEALKIPDLVASAPDDVFGLRILRYNFFATGGFYSGRQLKLFRNDRRLRYRRKINESVTDAIRDAGGRIEDASVLLNHFGHCRPVEARTHKAERYIELMKEQLADNPNDGVLIGYVGLILRTLGRFSEALEWSNRAVAIKPDSPVVRAFYGHVLRSCGDHGGALTAYKLAAAISPNDGAAWNMVGVMELTLSNLDAATASFHHALAVDPLQAHCMINQGMVAEVRGDHALAFEWYCKAADRNPGFLRTEWPGRLEHDPYREFYYETVTEYAGLSYHLAYASKQAAHSFQAAT